MATASVQSTRVAATRVRTFVETAFATMGFSAEDSAVGAEVLTLASLRGVDSHGISNLPRIYYPRWRDGEIKTHGEEKILHETPVSARVWSDHTLGLAAGRRGMQLAIKKAADVGAGFVVVDRARHFGMAAAHAMLALDHDMIGFACCNAFPGVVAAGSVDNAFGTNPIAFAIPAGEERPFVLDMATSVVALGKVNERARQCLALPPGWALGAAGLPTTDSVDAAATRKLLPLGGTLEGSGYKGTGLAFLVDILAGVLSGAGSSLMLGEAGRSVGFFFGAWRIDCFRPAAEFKRDLDQAIRAVKSLAPAPGVDRVRVAGEPEFDTARTRGQSGIPIDPALRDQLATIADELKIGRLL